MKEFDYNEFNEYFYKEIYPLLIEPIAKRKKELEKPTSVGIFFMCAFMFSMGIVTFLNTPTLKFVLIPMAIVFLIIGLYHCNIAYNQSWTCDKEFKRKIYNIIFEKFDLKYDYVSEDVKKKYNKILLQLSFPMGNIDDIISGEYRGLNFNILDCSIMNNLLFNGLIVSAKIHKNFVKETIIRTIMEKPSEHDSKYTNLGKQKVLLEDIEFNKKFAIYADDQVEARYLLTTAFIERLKKYVEKNHYRVDVFFTKRTYLDSNIFLFIDTHKNHFEIPEDSKRLTDSFYYASFFDEITNILNIIDSLKLAQNIGM